MIIHEFYDWLLVQSYSDEIKIDITPLHFNEVMDNEQLKETICIDIENDKYLGKFVIWDDNSCFYELMDIKTTSTILHDRIDFNSLNELKSIYNNFIQYSISKIK